MTNEMIIQGLQLADTNGFATIVCDGGPIWPYLIGIIWLLLIPIAPLLSLVLCIRAWRRHNRDQPTPCTWRVILGMALLMMTISGMNALLGIGQAFYYAGTNEAGAAQNAMLAMSISHNCTMLLIACGACSFCLFCALCLPNLNSNNQTANNTLVPTVAKRSGGTV